MKRNLAFFGLFGILCLFIVNEGHTQSQNLEWFREVKFGVFVHFLGGGEHWNEQVNAFNVQNFAEQVNNAHAGYVIFTLGQNSGYYDSPNANYEKLAGYEKGERCSQRDLPLELSQALTKYGIRLMLYLPSRSPQQDEKAMKNLHDVNERQPAPQEFTQNWSAVIREWSLRYGTQISGWWFDGAYSREGWDDLSQPYNWNTWAEACRAGNPESILAFNPGTDIHWAFSRLCAPQDYTAGEQNTFEATPEINPAPEGLQWHILSSLGSRWAQADGPTRSDEYMIDYIRKVNAQGGVVSIDVHVSNSGEIYEPHYRQLQAIGAQIKK